jgi:hypothetical protein
MQIVQNNIPVFRAGNNPSIDTIVGTADLVIDEDSSTITIRAGKQFTDFIKLGELKVLGLDLTAMITKVDVEKAKEWYEQHGS